MFKTVLLFLGLLISTLSIAQNFEGYIVYDLNFLNPNPEKIAENTWLEQATQMGVHKQDIQQRYYYKNDHYFTQVGMGGRTNYTCYEPESGLIYNWTKGQNTAVTYDSKRNSDGLLEVLASEDSETILDIPCESLVFKSVNGYIKVWYNKEHLKMAPENYKGHAFGHWESILKVIGCIPLKFEQKTADAHVVLTASSYKATSVKDAKFELPAFEQVIASPTN